MTKSNDELNENTINPLTAGLIGAGLGFLAGIATIALTDEDTKKQLKKELLKLKNKARDFVLDSQDKVDDLKKDITKNLPQLPKPKK